MSKGKIKDIFPPGNNGSQTGAARLTEDGTGTVYVFQTPDDVDPNVPLSAGEPVTFDVINGKNVGNVRVALPTCTITASPNPVNQGQSTTLKWTSTNAVSLFIDNGIGNVSPVDSGFIDTPRLNANVTFTITAKNASGLTNDPPVSVAVIVQPNTDPGT